MPTKYSPDQKLDALVSTTSNLTEALEIQNELRTEFLRSLLVRIDKLEERLGAERAHHTGALVAIVAELQRLKLAPALPAPGSSAAPADPDVVFVVAVPAVRITRAVAAKALGWVWSKIRLPVVTAAIAVWLWFMTKLGLNASQ